MTTTNPQKATQAMADLVARCYLSDDYPELLGDDWREAVEEHGLEFSWLDSDEIDLTLDALEKYDGATWREAEGREDMVIDGRPAIRWERVQAVKGQQRQTIAVVDLGAWRAIYQSPGA